MARRGAVCPWAHRLASTSPSSKPHALRCPETFPFLSQLTPTATEILLSTLHASPVDAVELARDVKAKHSIAMHFGTFCGSEDEAKEPLALLSEALRGKGEKLIGRDQGLWEEEGFGAVNVGETVFIPCERRIF